MDEEKRKASKVMDIIAFVTWVIFIVSYLAVVVYMKITTNNIGGPDIVKCMPFAVLSLGTSLNAYFCTEKEKRDFKLKLGILMLSFPIAIIFASILYLI